MARMDYSKVDNERLEGLTQSSKAEESKVKEAGFEFRMDRLDKSIKEAKNDKELEKFKGIREKTLGIYNKYHNSNFKN